MNQCIFTGRLVKDPVLEGTGEAVYTNFCIAVKRNFKNKDGEYESDFFYLKAWRKHAEFICKNIRKGDLTEVICTLRTEHYEKNGEKRMANALHCEELQLLSRAVKKEGGEPCSEEFDFSDELEA